MVRYNDYLADPFGISISQGLLENTDLTCCLDVSNLGGAKQQNGMLMLRFGAERSLVRHLHEDTWSEGAVVCYDEFLGREGYVGRYQ